jgi:hypothetical protein
MDPLLNKNDLSPIIEHFLKIPILLFLNVFIDMQKKQPITIVKIHFPMDPYID